MVCLRCCCVVVVVLWQAQAEVAAVMALKVAKKPVPPLHQSAQKVEPKHAVPLLHLSAKKVEPKHAFVYVCVLIFCVCVCC